MKTIAIRLDDDLHARLSVVAQLLGSTLSDEIRQAIEDRLDTLSSNPDVTGKAQAVLDSIEREAETRRQAIAGLLSSTGTNPAPKRSRKPAAE